MNVSLYPVQPALYAGEYPGHQDPSVARARLRELAALGIRTYVDLTTEEDRALGLLPYDEHFEEFPNRLLPERHSFAIPDMGIPADPSVMRGVLDLLHAEIPAGRACYVHCWGGIGRTGTVIACWLRENGWDADAALAEVQRLYSLHMHPAKQARYPRSPQQPAQIRYVKEWRR